MARGTWGGSGDRHPFQVKVSWVQGVNVCQTGFYVRATGAEIGDAPSIIAEVEDWVTESFRTILPSDYRVLGADVVDLVSREGASWSPSVLFGTATISGAQRMPGFLCVPVSLKGELRTRYGQGRMFFPVPNELAVDGDTLNVAGATGLQNVLDNLAGRLIGGSFAGYRLVNVHGEIPPKLATPTRPARPTIPPSWYDVTSLRLSTTVTALRSRKAGVGS